MNDSDAGSAGGRHRAWPAARVAITGWIIFLFALATAGASLADAQGGGRIVGRVVSARTGEPLAAVQVAVPGAGRSTRSDASGHFSLTAIPSGTHEVVAQQVGYARKTVTGVRVTAGEASALDLSLEPEALLVEGIVVSAQRERGSSAALLSERRRAATVVDAIGAEQIARAPDSDAAAALRRVPGVSVVDNKFVYVRGLGERYGATTLNGAPIPSPIPDKKAVPLDLIPASLLESVVTAKTYTPDQPGDYAGGLVQLETRSYPTSPLFKLSTSVGFESNTSLAAGLGYRGGRYDWLGFDDGARDLAGGVARNEPVRLPTDPQQRGAFLESVTRAWAPVERSATPLNQSWGVTYGNEIPVGDRMLGFLASGSYANRYSTTNDLVERFYAAGAGPALQVDYRGEHTTHEVALGGLLNAGVKLNDTDRLSVTTVYNRLVEDQARELGGLFESQGPYVRAPRLQYVANELLNAQLKGEHLVSPLGGLGAKWRLGYSRARRDEPNTRSVVYRAGEEQGPYEFFPGPASGLVFHQALGDRGFNGALDLRVPFTFRSLPSSLSLGGSAEARNRDVYTRRFRLAPNGGVEAETLRLGVEQLFVPERIGEGVGQFRVVEATFRQDNYRADQRVMAGYAMMDVEVLPRLRALAGARVESARQGLATLELLTGSASTVVQAALDDTDLLPALNLTFSPAEQTNLRLGLSRTVARPQFRELAPFLFADYYGGLTTRGNPFLERSRIANADLRWEWFFAPGALLSAGTFYKRFDAPIEPFAIVLGSSPGATWVNSESASLAGIELEFRTSLGALSEALETVAVNANLTVAGSRVGGDSVRIFNPDLGTARMVAVTGEGGRPLFGQSPYVVNLGATYELPGTGTSATLLFNRFGRRLDAFGGQGLPDIYEQGRSQLDLVVEHPLGRGMEVKLSAGRLLGNRVSFTQTFSNGETVTTRQFNTGRTLSLALSWEPGGL